MKWIIIYLIMGLLIMNLINAKVERVETDNINKNMNISGNNFLISYGNISYTLKPYAVVNGRYYTFDDLNPIQLRNLNVKYKVVQTETGYKFSYNFTKQLIVSEVGFAYTNFNYDIDTIYNENVTIDFSDLINQNYSVSINQTNIRITNLKDGFNDLDPLVTFTSTNNLGTDICDFALGCTGEINNTLALANNNNRLLFISLNYVFSVGSGSVSYVKYGDVNLPLLSSVSNLGGGFTEIYYYLGNMTTNNSNVLSIQFANDGSSAFTDSIQAEQFYNINQTNFYTQIKTNADSTSPIKVLINGTNENNMIVDFVNAFRGATTLSITPHNPQTSTYNTAFGTSTIRQTIGSSRKYGNVTSQQNNMSWTESTNRDWSSVAIELRFFNDTIVTPPSTNVTQDLLYLGFINQNVSKFPYVKMDSNTCNMPFVSIDSNITNFPYVKMTNDRRGLPLIKIE